MGLTASNQRKLWIHSLNTNDKITRANELQIPKSQSWGTLFLSCKIYAFASKSGVYIMENKTRNKLQSECIYWVQQLEFVNSQRMSLNLLFYSRCLIWKKKRHIIHAQFVILFTVSDLEKRETIIQMKDSMHCVGVQCS